jgi:energy-coupling factor transport system permease protein
MVLGLGVAALCLEGPGPLLLLALLPTLGLLLHPSSSGWRGRILGMILLITWSTVLSQGLFWAGWPRTPLWTLGPLHFYREGALHGLLQSARFIAALSGGALLAVSTPPDRLVSALITMRIPFGLALMAASSMRFLPLVAEEWGVVRQARDARSARRLRGPWTALRREAMLLQPLLARALRRSLALAESLDTRGFHPTAPRKPRYPLKLNRRDWMVWILGGFSLTGLLFCRLLFFLYRWEIYYLPAFRPLYAWIRTYL